MKTFGRQVTQRQLSQAMGLSNALISSWESGNAVPPEERLRAYARFFSSNRSIEGSVHLLPEDDLNEDETVAMEGLFEEFKRLRDQGSEEAPPPAPPTPPAPPRASDVGELGGRFLYYSDGQPITILCTPLSRRQLGYEKGEPDLGKLPPAVQYAVNRRHPNFVRNLANGDIDPLVEIVGHLRAENPKAFVQWFTYDNVSSPDQLTGHLILFGGIDDQLSDLPSGNQDTVGDFRDRLKTPVSVVWDNDGVEFDAEFVVTVDDDGVPTIDQNEIKSTEAFRSTFLAGDGGDDRGRQLLHGVPQLTSDVALIQRSINPFNPDTTVTRFGGMFSRGTYGAVRAFTDARFREGNEEWLNRNLDPDDFWMLIRVPVVANTTMTPAISNPGTLLKAS
ncbi:helix-turn-helix transcriptional regulator [Kineosporia sp. J2-2]|uniref:Helix-turn-helix transcriptional regulator n=2 Tax=Kineosporia corallincola TaxID=2835133 RepID=A0ABS5T9S7_9ACTN|nr:helix-turn-helix transcriptional regulator [Kineosporia corallincola]